MSSAGQVSQAILEGLPATLELAIFAFVASVVLGAIIGFARARVRPPVLRGALAVAQLAGRAMPVVLLALFFQMLFMFTTSLPAAGAASVDAFDLRDRLAHLIQPVLFLAVPFGAWSSLVFYDFFRASDSGLPISPLSVVGPVATTAGSIGPALLSACIFIEPIFAWPGVARLFYNGIADLDISMGVGFLLTYSVGVALFKLCAALPLVIWGWRMVRRTASPRISAIHLKGFSAIGVIALVVLLAAVLAAVTANLIAPANPDVIDQAHWQGYPLAPGVAGHLLGTDENGRDLMARLIFGLRTSLGIAALAALIAIAIGAVVAKAAPWFGGLGTLSLIGIRPFAGLPFILAAIALLASNHHAAAGFNPFTLALIIATVSWPAIVPAFRALNAATLGGVVGLVAGTLLVEVTLSVFGFGVQPPASSLGNMLVNARANLFIAPWAALIPSVAVVVTLFALNAVADDLRDMRDPAQPAGELQRSA